VIPTRERHRTLASAIESVLFQDFPFVELVVMDNCSGPETWDVVKRYRDPRIKYERSERVLPMNENWERGLAASTGEFVFFLGDDDALMPDGLRLANDILSRVPLDVLAWDKYTYWWEDAIEPSLRGRLFLHYSNGFRMLNAHEILEGHYNWRVSFGALPSIYTGLVGRRLIDRIRARTGGTYFAAGSPDVYTGIANAYFGEQLGFFERGLSMCGNSGRSTGCSHFFRSRGSEQRSRYYGDEGKTVRELLHPSLIETVSLEVNLADAQIRAKELLFPQDDRYRMNYPAMVASMAANVNRDPGSYDETVADLRALAERFSVDLAGVPIPPRADVQPAPLQGLLAIAEGRATVAVNAPEAGVRTAAQAARLAGAMLPVLTIQ
jgi:glycosyltransferase involved in cell wall biosynthesis